jgi:aromatase
MSQVDAASQVGPATVVSAPDSPVKEVEHRVTVRVGADDLYRYVADVSNWPRMFPPTVHVEYLERGGDTERLRIWATANGEAKTWTSRRVLDPVNLRVEFRQERSQDPVASMGGTWIIEALTDSESLLRLLHDYRAIDDDPAKLAWLDSAVDRNSRSELAALKAGAELAGGASELAMSFEDSVRIDGTAADAYDFINEANLWQERLPHVERVSLTEDTPGLQVLEMDTRTPAGVHTTKSVRVCLPHSTIVYKQTEVPPLMTVHTGAWTFTDTPEGATISSRHTVVINQDNITAILGETAGVGEARTFIRDALGRNSMTTMRHAKEYAESRR